ncbi:STAS domain-containing protein [Hymenobacter rubripertinctus]|nr:STAS domain-containing protein [Hymenobacter rubripertinctus]
MEVYREILPDSYLLMLTSPAEPADAIHLTQALRWASQSGKRSIWVDCSQLPALPPSSLRVLLRYYQRLRRRQIPLVLCHLNEAARHCLDALPSAQRPPMVASLLEAEHYCRFTHPLLARAVAA